LAAYSPLTLAVCGKECPHDMAVSEGQIFRCYNRFFFESGVTP
jgi:hypothetical protein